METKSAMIYFHDRHLFGTQNWIFIMVLISYLQDVMGESCEEEKQCGWNAYCNQGSCECIPGFRWTYNVKDCYDTKCSDSRCLTCSSRSTCKRCVDFIEEGTGECLDKCDSSYVFMVEGNQVGRVCSASSGDGMMTLYVAIIIGVSAGVLLTALIAIAFYWKLRSDSGKNKKVPVQVVTSNGSQPGSFKNKNKIQPVISNGYVPGQTQLPSSVANGQVNMGCDYENGDAVSRMREQSAFLHKVAMLRPHTDTYVDMLAEAKQKVRALQEEDNRVYVYKNIIHQLCRVLTILNSEDSQIVMPPDGESLLNWAEKIRHKYNSVQQAEQEPDYCEPNCNYANTGAVTSSTFRPDQKIIPSETVTANNSTSNTYTYEKLDENENDSGYRNETLTLQSLNVMILDPQDFTEPIEV